MSANDVADFGQSVGSERGRRLLALSGLANHGRRKSFGDGCSKADSGTHGDLDSPKSEIFTTFWGEVSPLWVHARCQRFAWSNARRPRAIHAVQLSERAASSSTLTSGPERSYQCRPHPSAPSAEDLSKKQTPEDPCRTRSSH